MSAQAITAIPAESKYGHLTLLAQGNTRRFQFTKPYYIAPSFRSSKNLTLQQSPNCNCLRYLERYDATSMHTGSFAIPREPTKPASNRTDESQPDFYHQQAQNLLKLLLMSKMRPLYDVDDDDDDDTTTTLFQAPPTKPATNSYKTYI